jgi:ubiquinone/menaquinone biosynthesis C-methylase UbiE
MTEQNHTSATRDFFERRAEDWSAQYRPSGGMSDRVVRFFHPLHERVATGAPILDLGCGTGEIARAAAESWTVTAADLSARMLDEARERSGAVPIRWAPLDGVRLPFADGEFAAVLASSVLEYVADLPSHLAEVNRILRSGGYYIATVPDPRHPARAAERRKQRRALNDHFFRLIRLTRWRSDYEYLRLSINRFELETWRIMFADAGLTVDGIDPCSHPLALLIAQKR